MRKRIFITGGTGFIGQQLVRKLSSEANEVVVLVRSPEKAVVFKQLHVSIVYGDLDNIHALETGMDGASEVFHLAAFARVWAGDNSFERINVTGTKNILDVALKKGVDKLVVTSTAGVLGPAIDGVVHEETVQKTDFFTDYERTKFESEKLVKEYADKGLQAVIVNPTRVYGPGPLNISNAVTKLIMQYAQGSWKFIPGDGTSVGNYVFVEDVVNGHILAMKHGRSGERYLLGGEDISYNGLFDLIAQIHGRKYKLYPIPLWVMLAFGKIQLFLATLFGRTPLITPGWVRKYSYHWQVSSEKAKRELGYTVTPLASGIGKTLEWIKKGNSPEI